jgi:hypothetical protein
MFAAAMCSCFGFVRAQYQAGCAGFNPTGHTGSGPKPFMEAPHAWRKNESGLGDSTPIAPSATSQMFCSFIVAACFPREPKLSGEQLLSFTH